jgi:uncharacterized protein YjiK
MIIVRGLGLLAVLISGAVSCRETPEAKAAQVQALRAARQQALARRIAMADSNQTTATPLAIWVVAPELREISGLTLLPDGTVLAHDDEVAKVYQIDPKAGIVLKQFSLDGAPHGDFEAITTAGTDIYLLQSNGHLWKFKDGADGGVVPYTRYNTRLGRECEFESLAYEPDSSRLLLACKKVGVKNLKDDLVIYRLPLPISDSSTMTMLAIPLTAVIGTNPWKNFEPSDMAIDPTTGNYVVIASLQKGLAVITPAGDVVRSEPLPGNHHQAEGVAITKDSLLIISDEATSKPAAITVYRWRP